jgi:DNA ligase (NAD+)
LVEKLRKIKPDSPVLEEVGSDLAPAGKKIEHSSPMLSLDKCYELEDLMSWAKKLQGEVAASPKIDGLAIAIRYGAKGELEVAETRGDGVKGDDITQNVRRVKNIPHKISLPNLEIRGEIYMPLSVFKDYQSEFANPRNLAAGALKHKDPEKTQEYRLSFFAYEIFGREVADEREAQKILKSMGFEPVATRFAEIDPEQLKKIFEEYLTQRDRFDFEVDGVVYKASSMEVRNRLGASAHHPRWAIAYKFQGDSGTSILRDVEWSVSRTGTVTPIGIIDPVKLSGAMVSRVSLHNVALMKEKGVTLGAQVSVMRRGGVIPNLEKVLKKTDRPVVVPKQCPSCGYATEVRDEFLHCTNPKGCRKSKLGELRHFVDVMEIDGFGTKLIEQLYDAGFVEEIYDFYTLTVDDLLSLERVGEILAKKLIGNIESRRSVPLALFLRSLGIHELGKHMSQLLEKKYRNLESILNVTEEELVQVHTVGEIIAKEVTAGLRKKKKIINRLLKYVRLKEKTSAKEGALSGKSFLFTGKMATMPRGEAEKQVEANGGEIALGVTKDLDYLVIGSEGYKNRDKGNKWIKAETLIQKGAEIKILSEEEFFKLLGK